MLAYRSKLSGPLLDRFDLVVDVPPVELRALTSAAPGECSQAVRERVVITRQRQRRRYGAAGPTCNARLAAQGLERHARLPARSLRLLISASERLGLSARGFDRVRRVARTLADMEGEPAIAPHHVAEALQYRHVEFPAAR